MKKTILIIFTAAALMACNSDPRAKLPQTGNFGQTVTEDATVITADQVAGKIDQQVKVSGTIAEYCKGEGCWLSLQNPAGEPLFVEIENKAFVLPHNISGKTAVVTGKVVQENNEVKVLANGVLIK